MTEDRPSVRAWRAIRAAARRVPFLRRAVRRLRAMDEAPPVPPRTPEQAEREHDEWLTSVLSVPKFWKPNYWEPTVQFPLRDYCRPGDVVFDVGANAGGLSALMSRLVGPRGVVCAFEASPRIISATQRNLANAGCFNTQVYHRAIYHTSHEQIAIYAGSHLNDSIYSGVDFPEAVPDKVETLALDDFVAATGLVPRLIKMDIEGAEFDALQGMKRLLAEARPILILEQDPRDMRCHALLSAQGYAAIDLASYRRIRSDADFSPGATVANVLFIHPSTGAGDPYLDETPPETVARIAASAFRRSPAGVETETPIVLPPGRYICRADFSASGTGNDVYAGIEVDGEVVLRYRTYSRYLAESYRDWVFDLRRTSQVAAYLRFMAGTDDTLDWRGVTIVRLPQFDRVPPRHDGV